MERAREPVRVGEGGWTTAHQRLLSNPATRLSDPPHPLSSSRQRLGLLMVFRTCCIQLLNEPEHFVRHCNIIAVPELRGKEEWMERVTERVSQRARERGRSEGAREGARGRGREGTR
jgi:hypothetical protein